MALIMRARAFYHVVLVRNIRFFISVLFFFASFFESTKTHKKLSLVHSLVLQNNRARAFACVHLPRIENNTSHSDRPTREEELSLPLLPSLRERTNAFGALVFLSLSFCGQHPSAVKKEAARTSNKKSPPRKTTPFFYTLLRERGRIIENK